MIKGCADTGRGGGAGCHEGSISVVVDTLAVRTGLGEHVLEEEEGGGSWAGGGCPSSHGSVVLPHGRLRSSRSEWSTLSVQRWRRNVLLVHPPPPSPHWPGP